MAPKDELTDYDENNYLIHSILAEHMARQLKSQPRTIGLQEVTMPMLQESTFNEAKEQEGGLKALFLNLKQLQHDQLDKMQGKENQRAAKERFIRFFYSYKRLTVTTVVTIIVFLLITFLVLLLLLLIAVIPLSTGTLTVTFIPLTLSYLLLYVVLVIYTFQKYNTIAMHAYRIPLWTFRREMGIAGLLFAGLLFLMLTYVNLVTGVKNILMGEYTFLIPWYCVAIPVMLDLLVMLVFFTIKFIQFVVKRIKHTRANRRRRRSTPFMGWWHLVLAVATSLVMTSVTVLSIGLEMLKGQPVQHALIDNGQLLVLICSFFPLITAEMIISGMFVLMHIQFTKLRPFLPKYYTYMFLLAILFGPVMSISHIVHSLSFLLSHTYLIGYLIGLLIAYCFVVMMIYEE